MINGDVSCFLDSLHVFSDVEVAFRGKRYFIHGWCDWDEPDDCNCHIHMYEVASGRGVYERAAGSPSDCVSALLDAPVWEGLAFREAEPEIEWVA